MTQKVTLVDESDNVRGTMEKMEAHIKGELHRAYSVFLFDASGRMLLQQRAENKYHSGGLWTNACCSHPGPEDDLQQSAQQRLKEEMGVSCTLQKLFVFTYKADVGNGLIEHELDHVFAGRMIGEPKPDTSEVQAWKWLSLQDLTKDIEQNPANYTAWFRIAFPMLKAHIERTEIV